VPGVLHQGILSLLCDDPWLAFDLHGRERPVDGIPIDRRADLDHETDDPDKLEMRYVDVVLVVRDPVHRNRGVVLDVEVQRKRTKNKRWRISGYLGRLEDTHELPAVLVLASFSLAFSREARSWAASPGTSFDMLLLDIETVPIPATIESALVRPTATVLAAALHGCRGNLDAVRMGIAACQDLPERQKRGYIATMLAAVPKRLRPALMKGMNVEQENELWDIERRGMSYSLGHEHGRNEGLERGRNEGLERGRNEARRAALVEMIFTVLDVRGIPIDANTRAQIRECESLATLQDWARRAREVSSAHELFEPG
jgi:hypothetical protein